MGTTPANSSPIITPVCQFVARGHPYVPYSDRIANLRLKACFIDGEQNYGQALRVVWSEVKPCHGLVVLEQDIAVPLEAWEELDQHICRFPWRVIAIPYLLYPATTGRSDVHWAHRLRRPDGAYMVVPSIARCPIMPHAFGLGCTYLPARLLDAMPDDLSRWGYPVLDTRLSELAQRLGVPIATTLTTAVHLHY